MKKILCKLASSVLAISVVAGGGALNAQADAIPATQNIYNAAGLAYYLNKIQSGTASVDGNTVTLKKNITLSDYIVFSSKADVTLDLERHTVTFTSRTDFLSMSGSTFTLTDAGSVVTDGVPAVTADGGTVNIVKDTDSPHASVCGYTKGVPELIQKSDSSNAVCCIYDANAANESVLTIGDVYIESNGFGINLTGGTTTITNASVHAAKRAIDGNMATPENASSVLSIAGGTFEADTFETVNISGTGYTEANDCTAKVTISGGNFIANEKYADTISLWKGAELVVPENNGISFHTDGGAGIAANASHVTVSDISIPGVVLQSGAVFTATDSEIVRDDGTPILDYTNGVVTLKNTDVTTSSGTAILLYNNAILNVEGGTILSTSETMDWYNFLIQGWNDSQISLKNCNVEGVSGVRLKAGSTLSVEETTIKSTADESYDYLGTGVYIEGSSSAYIDSTDITANWGIECYGGSSLTLLGGNITGLNPLDVDYCNPDAKICIVDSSDYGITLNATGSSAPIYVEKESSTTSGYGLLQLSENVYKQAVKSDCNAGFIKDQASGSYVTEKTDLESYRQYFVQSPVIYNVTYVGTEGAENTELNPTEVNSLKSYKLVDLSKYGSVFMGWYTDSSYTEKITKIDRPSGDMTLYAKFAKIDTTAPKLSYKVDTKGVTLSWTKISGADSYAVYRDNGNGLKLLKKTTSLSYKDTGISNGSIGHYKVIPCLGDTNGTASNEIYIKYYNKAATVKIAGVAKGNKLTISGVPASDTKYTIYRSDNGGAYKALKTLTGQTTVYTDTSLTNGHKYNYYVIYMSTKYVNFNYVKSPISNTVGTYYIKSPVIKYLKSTSSKTATVKWAKNSSASGYQIQYGLKSSFSGAKTVTLKKKTCVSKKLKSLKKKKKYYVRMRTYKTVSGKKYFSCWSSKKSVKIKK